MEKPLQRDIVELPRLLLIREQEMAQKVETAAARVSGRIPPILRLPAELLTWIAELATADQPRDSWRYRSAIRNDKWVTDGNDFECDSWNTFRLCLVSRRFYAIACPILYRHLVIEMNAAKNGHLGMWGRRSFFTYSGEAISDLRRTLETTPSLHRYCRTLHIGLYSSNDPDEVVGVSNLVQALSNTRKLRLFVSRQLLSLEQIAPIMASVRRHMNNLEALQSLGDNHLDGWEVAQLMLALPQLRSLQLSIDAGRGTEEIAEQNWKTVKVGPSSRNGFPATTSTNESGFTLHQERVMALTSLHIHGCQSDPSTIRRLLLLPKNLEHFSFRLGWNDENVAATLPLLFSHLSPHRKALRSIEIGCLFNDRPTGLDGFSLAGFESLETLELPKNSTGSQDGYEKIAAAPRLKTFSWNFQSDDSFMGLCLDHFRQAEEDWIRGLAAAAARRKSPLENIHVIFEPDNWGVPPEVWPWDRMDNIAKDFRDAGITVTYTEPNVTKSQIVPYYYHNPVPD